MSNQVKPMNRRLFAALDLSVMDKYILTFLRKNAESLTSTKILFIHVAEKSADNEGLRQKLKKHIEEFYPEALEKHELLVLSGDPEKEIKDWSSDEHMDLLILGEKATADRDVKLKKLVEKSSASLLILPKKEEYTLRRIGVATDFSDFSKLAAKEAHDLSEQLGTKLIGYHAYQVPSGYHKSGKDHKEFAEVMEKNAKEDAAKFWGELNLETPEMKYVYDEKEEPSTCISDFAEGNEIDLMMIGSKGRTAAASIIMGSVAKEVVQKLNTVPLMVLKEKNSKMDALDALKEL